MADSALSLLWDSTRLRLLVEIDRQGSVSAAARAIGIGQPTRERAPAPARGRRRAATGRAKRPRQPPHRRRQACSPSTPARRSQTLAPAKRSFTRSPASRRARSTSAPRPPPASTCSPTRSAASAATTPTSTVEVEIASTGEILDRLLAGRVQLALVGETDGRRADRARAVPVATRSSVSRSPVFSQSETARSRPSALAEQTLLVREASSSTRRVSEQALAERRRLA